MPIKIEVDALDLFTEKMSEIVGRVEKIETSITEPKFYSINDVAKILGWSEPTVQDLFNRRDFPSCDFGRRKVVEMTALKKYFSVPRRK